MASTNMFIIKAHNLPQKFTKFLNDGINIENSSSFEEQVNRQLQSASMNIKYIDNGKDFSRDELIFESEQHYTLFLLEWS